MLKEHGAGYMGGYEKLKGGAVGYKEDGENLKGGAIEYKGDGVWSLQDHTPSLR